MSSRARYCIRLAGARIWQGRGSRPVFRQHQLLARAGGPQDYKPRRDGQADRLAKQRSFLPFTPFQWARAERGAGPRPPACA